MMMVGRRVGRQIRIRTTVVTVMAEVAEEEEVGEVEVEVEEEAVEGKVMEMGTTTNKQMDLVDLHLAQGQILDLLGLRCRKLQLR